MSASQDKVQGILETLLEESLPLVHKGIFTSEQLQAAMCEREKLENNMLKPTYKLSDYLKAIQFQYALQRTRKFRAQTLSSTNPLFKKQSKTDYIILKRIIRLWDRTMHKFKYNVDLWKQYLNFCVKTNSKNQFYKALSNGLRFLPFCQDLWLIGVQYEVEVGLNLWKARKLFFKALKMNASKQRLWLQMFKFQIHFLKVLYERERAIEGTQTFGFITNHNDQNIQIEDQNKIKQQQNQQVHQYGKIKLEQHDDVIFMVYSEAINKIQSKSKAQYHVLIIETLENQIKQAKIKEVGNILKKALNKINQYYTNMVKSNKIQKIQQPQRPTNLYLTITTSSIQQKQRYYQQYLSQTSNPTIEQLDKIMCQFLTKPPQLTKLVCFYLQQNQNSCLTYLLSSKKIKIQNLPSQLLTSILHALNSNVYGQKYIKQIKKIIKNVNTNKYIQNLALLESVIKINKRIKNYKVNNDIYRSINVLCKKQPEITQRCLTWIHQSNQQD